MRFMEVMTEYIDGYNWNKWREEQILLWNNLVIQNLVDKNNAELFYKLGKYFDAYNREHPSKDFKIKTPSVLEVMKHLKLKP